MKNVNEVLTEKELKVEVLKREIEALRITATLVADPELPERKSPTTEKPADVKEGTTGSAVLHATVKHWP
jgi:hypothetical protein